MKRNEKLRMIRINFVKLAIQDPKQAGQKLILMGRGLKNTKNCTDVIYALTQIFGVSEKTIFRDLNTD
jgi:hypothetical protein